MTRRILLVIVALCASVSALNAGSQQAPDEAGTWTGTLHFGIVAVGGETTGIVLETSKGKLEIQPATKAVLAALKKLDGRRITVGGTLVTVTGIERRQRRIITVTKVAPARPAPPL